MLTGRSSKGPLRSETREPAYWQTTRRRSEATGGSPHRGEVFVRCRRREAAGRGEASALLRGSCGDGDHRRAVRRGRRDCSGPGTSISSRVSCACGTPYLGWLATLFCPNQNGAVATAGPPSLRCRRPAKGVAGSRAACRRGSVDGHGRGVLHRPRDDGRPAQHAAHGRAGSRAGQY